MYHQEWAHRSLPLPLVRPLIEVQARRAWSSPATREKAALQLRFLLGKSSRASEVEDLIPAYLLQSLLRAELRWRPWVITRQHIVGVDRLLAAQRHGRGAILNSMHHGFHDGFAASFSNIGVRAHVAVAPVLLDNPSSSQRQLVAIGARHSYLFRAQGSYPQMADLLRHGQVVSLTNDLPGTCPMTILGRRVRAASGAARLALEVGAPIVPVTAHRRGWLQTLHVQEPIDPREFSAVGELQQEIARRHEPAMLAWPEAVEQPLRRWLPADPQDIATFDISAEQRAAFML